MRISGQLMIRPSATVEELMPPEAIEQLARQAAESYVVDDVDNPRTTLYSIQTVFYNTNQGIELGTMTYQAEGEIWEVWVGTKEEIERKHRETQANEQASSN